MDDDENKPGITQIPLLHDLLYDASLPLRPPPRPTGTKNKINYSPDYDPDTLDLFKDEESGADLQLNESVADELRESAGQMIDDLVEEFSQELSHRLRGELTDQLASILKELNHRTDPDKAP